MPKLMDNENAVSNLPLRETLEEKIRNGGETWESLAYQAGYVMRSHRGKIRGDATRLKRRCGVVPNNRCSSLTRYIKLDALDELCSTLNISPWEVGL